MGEGTVEPREASDADRSRRTRRAVTLSTAVVGLLLPGVALIAISGAVLVAVNAVGLYLDEGAVPPISQLPDLPDSAEITSQEEVCGSGGCWWSVTITPPAGQMPDDLAAAMGIDEDLLLGGTILRPRETYLESESSGSDLHVVLGYTDPFA